MLSKRSPNRESWVCKYSVVLFTVKFELLGTCTLECFCTELGTCDSYLYSQIKFIKGFTTNKQETGPKFRIVFQSFHIYIFIYIDSMKNHQFSIFIINLFLIVMTFFRWSLMILSGKINL